jgi:formylglycine-generating enzyme required for sulfatase activity
MSGWSRDWTVANNATPGTMYATTQVNLRVALDGCNGAGAAASITGWLDDVARANDDRPMSCVTWYEAFLFCIWDQGRLPTETEWNVAAAGGEQYRAYPWDPADQPGALTVTPADGNIGPALGFPPMRVGSFPDGAGRWGQEDLAGNVYEFVRDRAAGLKPATYTAATSNPIELVGDFAVIRGGSYVFDLLRARSAYRFAVHDRDDPPARRQLDLGWRCARSP